MNRSIQIIQNSVSLNQVFRGCCEKYDKLQMFVAWVGNPYNTIPFDYLKNLDSVQVTVGISFCQSHPDGIEYLMGLDSKMRIVFENPLFHPKVYIFSKGRSRAMIIGSSNFTYSGFYENVETNILLEGKEHESIIKENEAIFQKWNLDDVSFSPTKEWLLSYRIRFSKRQKSLKKVKLKDESSKENDYAIASSWLNKSGWPLYVKKIMTAVSERYDDDDKDVLKGKLERLKEYKDKLRLPWKLSYFDEIDKRRMMGGLPPYAWLGHVAASGFVRKLLANGTKQQKAIVISCINKIGDLKIPLDWKALEKELDTLESLGPSIKGDCKINCVRS